MIHSMTAFAQLHKELGMSSLSWEIKSINHRYLDISFYLPEAFRSLEPLLRQRLRDTVSRGKIECQLKHQDTNSHNPSMIINMGMINALMELSDELSSLHQLPNDLAVSQVLAWPGVLQNKSLDVEDLYQTVTSLFEGCMENLVKARRLEGSSLKSHISSRLTNLKTIVTLVQSQVPLFAQKTKEKLLARLQSLSLKEAEERVAQEIAFILARFDITEELDRLQIHIGEVARVLEDETVVGRRLDFLMQELHREVNTLGSKSDNIELSQAMIDMKVFIEQMREQIQNIE